MPLIVLGLVVLIAIAGYLRFTAGRDPGAMMRIARYAGIAALTGITIFLAVTERWVPAVFLAGIGWSLYTRGRAVPEHWFPRDEPAPPPPAAQSRMSRGEAFQVLGLPSGASADAVRDAYKRLILQNHPDRGGSDYLAAKINQAKDVLLGG